MALSDKRFLYGETGTPGWYNVVERHGARRPLGQVYKVGAAWGSHHLTGETLPGTCTTRGEAAARLQWMTDHPQQGAVPAVVPAVGEAASYVHPAGRVHGTVAVSNVDKVHLEVPRPSLGLPPLCVVFTRRADDTYRQTGRGDQPPRLEW